MKMRIYLFLLLNVAFIGSIKLNQRKITNEIEYKEKENKVLNLSKEEKKNYIELEPDYIITQIQWTKNEDYDLNYLLGIFEGANDPSFSDSVPLSMIKESGKLNEVNLIDVDTPNTYKYVRYVPPNKNYSDISPIKIIGHNVNQAAEDTKKKGFPSN